MTVTDLKELVYMDSPRIHFHLAKAMIAYNDGDTLELGRQMEIALEEYESAGNVEAAHA